MHKFIGFLVLIIHSSLAFAQNEKIDPMTDPLYSALGIYKPAFDRHMKDQRQKMVTKVIIVDTRDKEKCGLVQTQLAAAQVQLENFCEVDPKRPFRSVTLQRPVTEQDFMASPEHQTPLNRLTAHYLIAGVATIAFLYTLPAESTNWTEEKKDFATVTNRYFEHVKGGPVMDNDDAYYNYVLHPIAGAWYYTSARHEGLSAKESFKFSVLMSTFFWEFGLEAVPERPSIQDLIITPLAGAFFGEMFFRIQNHVESNGRRVRGSRTLGEITLLLVNPVDALATWINRTAGGRLIKRTEFRVTGIPTGEPGRWAPGLALKFIY